MTDPITPHRRVAIVHLGRAAAMGGVRRVAGMRAVFEAAGAEVHEVPLLADATGGSRSILGRDVRAVAAGRAVPETLAWSAKQAVSLLEAIDPDLVVASTARSFHPSFAERWPVVLDFIDRLSVSYRDRAEVRRGPAGLGFRLLAARNERFELAVTGPRIRRVAAGWADAEALDAEWLPITLDLGADLSAVPDSERPFDAVFVGNLSYAPNVEAIDRLATVWPMVRRQRPGARLLLAGARPSLRIRQLAADAGWELRADFDRLDDVLGSARLAVAPLTHASGIQTKVLDAAAHGLPQVVSPAAAAGLDPAFPVEVAATDDELTGRVVALLADPDGRVEAGRAARSHIAGEYSSERWVPWARSSLGD